MPSDSNREPCQDYIDQSNKSENQFDSKTKNCNNKRSRNSKSNEFSHDSLADSEIIAAITDENLKKLNIDPNSKEGKKVRRKIRNRMSAQLHRERKKNYIDTLEELVKEKDSTILLLQNQINSLVLENEKLRSGLNINTDEVFHDVSQKMSPTSKKIKINHTSQSYESYSANSMVTTSESDSETSSVQSKDETNSHSLQSRFSLFSFFLFVGFTFWGFPQIPLEVSLSNNDQSYSAVQTSFGQSTNIPGRLLLADTNKENENLFISTSHNINDYNSQKTKLPVVSLKDSNNLWFYEDELMQLYPTDIEKLSLNDTSNIPNKKINTEKLGNLRQRNKNISNHENEAPSIQNINIEKYFGNPSKIVVMSGKAVFDPLLLPVRAADNIANENPYKSNIPSKSLVSSYYPSSSRQESKDYAISSWHNLPSSDIPDPSLKMKALTVTHSPPVSLTTNEIPMLMMLLPASLIKWGTSWNGENNNEEAFNAFMNNLNKENQTNSGNPDIPDESSLWIEIGCSVFKAQLVRNVTLM